MFDGAPTQATTTAAESFALKRGVCQDLTHIFIAAARSIAVPARYIGGHFQRNDGVTDQEAGHAWAEAYVPDFGWIAFDPANGICATDARRHVRVAVGLDYLGAAPVRGTRFGGGARRSMWRCGSVRSAVSARADSCSLRVDAGILDHLAPLAELDLDGVLHLLGRT